MTRTTSLLFLLSLATGVYAAEAPAVQEDVVLGADVGNVNVRIFIPRQADRVRGLIVHAANYGLKSDDRWAELCRQHRFAHVAMNIPNVQKANNRQQALGKALEQGLAEFATKSGHPELTRLPMVGTGHSAGGLVTGVLLKTPDRTLTNTIDCGWVMDPAKLSPEAAAVPALFTMGAIPDAFKMLPAIERNFEPARKNGSPWAVGVQWECAHDFGNAATLQIAWIDAIIRARLPADASAKLRDIQLADGWLGDRSTIETNFASINAWGDFKADRSVAAWFPNRSVASVWRAWESKDSPVTLDAAAVDGKSKLPARAPKVSRDLQVDPGVDVVLSATVKGDLSPKSIRFYDGDEVIGQGSAAAEDWRLTWKSAPPGCHFIYAQWEAADGKPGVSNPALIIVRTP
jgi:hypothetical protein